MTGKKSDILLGKNRDHISLLKIKESSEGNIISSGADPRLGGVIAS